MTFMRKLNAEHTWEMHILPFVLYGCETLSLTLRESMG